MNGTDQPCTGPVNRQSHVARLVRPSHHRMAALAGTPCDDGARHGSTVGEQLKGEQLARPHDRRIGHRHKLRREAHGTRQMGAGAEAVSHRDFRVTGEAFSGWALGDTGFASRRHHPVESLLHQVAVERRCWHPGKVGPDRHRRQIGTRCRQLHVCRQRATVISQRGVKMHLAARSQHPPPFDPFRYDAIGRDRKDLAEVRTDRDLCARIPRRRRQPEVVRRQARRREHHETDHHDPAHLHDASIRGEARTADHEKRYGISFRRRAI